MFEKSLFNNKCFDGLNFAKKVYRILTNLETKRKYIRDRNSKKIIEELRPIAKFVQVHYLPGMRIRWVDGSQPYDGILYFRGKKKLIEVTSAVHKKDQLYRKYFIENNYSVGGFEDPSKPSEYSNNEHVLKVFNWIQESIQKKKNKKYIDPRILVIQFFPDTCFLQEDYEELKNLLKNSKDRKFPEIFIINGDTHDFFSL